MKNIYIYAKSPILNYLSKTIWLNLVLFLLIIFILNMLEIVYMRFHLHKVKWTYLMFSEVADTSLYRQDDEEC